MYNKVFLIGNLTRDPETRYTSAEVPMSRFSIAVNRPGRKREDSTNSEVDFINIVAWRRLAEICKEYLKKGKPIAVEGRLQVRKYEKDGEKKTFFEVVADNIQMLGSRQGYAAQGTTSDTAKVEAPGLENDTENKEEVPF